MNPPRPESQRSAASRLTDSLGYEITRSMVRSWLAKGFDLTDLKSLKRSIRNQERQPAASKTPKTTARPDTPEPPVLDADDIEGELARLKRDLLMADDYEEARKIRTQISGLRDILKEFRERGLWMPLSEALEGAAMCGTQSRAAWESIEDSLPPMLEGLTALQMKEKLRAFARNQCLELSKYFRIVPPGSD